MQFYLDRATGGFEEFSPSENPDQARLQINGHFSHLDGKTVALYRDDEVLYFRADHQEIRMTDETRVEWQELPIKEKKIRLHLCILRGESVLFDWVYTHPPYLSPSWNPIAIGSEEEDFDFGLFVYNVNNDSGRKRRIYANDMTLYE